MNSCDYVEPVREERGIQYDDDLFSHTIYNNSLCIQSDDGKTATNIEDLGSVAELPIYCVFAHGKIISDVNIAVDDDFNYHVTTPPTTFFNLHRNQYIYDTAPLGSLLMCSPHLNEYFGHVINNPPGFLEILFSTNFKEVSAPIATGDFDLDSPLFSPPQFTTINKTLDFYEDVVKSPLRFGVVQLNKPMDDEVVGILQSIGQRLITNTPEEKINRCFNISSYKLTNNPEAEHAFIRHLHTHNFRCTLEELTTIFGPGIYIMSTCSPLNLVINGDGIGKIHYSSEMGIKSKLKNPAHSIMVEKAVYAFNSDLESMVYNLNYRWLEMVQNKEAIEIGTAFPQVDVKTGKMYPDVADIKQDEDETGTQPDEDMSYMDIDVNGGKKLYKKRKQSVKKLYKKRKQSVKRHKRTRTRTHISNRRRLAHRRSKRHPSHV